MTSVNWDLLSLKCANCGNDMNLMSGEFGAFYTCAAYPKCFNRMNTEMYEKALDHVTKLIMEDDRINYTGHEWEFKSSHQNYKFKIKAHYPNQIIINVLNVKKLGSSKK